MQQGPAISLETYSKAIQKFKTEFCEDVKSVLSKTNIDKIIAPLDSRLLLAIKQVFGIQPVTCHYLYVKSLWQMASRLGLRQRRFMPNTKKIVDTFKKFPFDKPQHLEARFEKARRDYDGLTFVNPRYIEFFNMFRKQFLFDNSKSEEFDVYPHRVWNMAEVVV